MAGESARVRTERLARSSASWGRGARAQKATAASLAALPDHEWVVLHGLPWPGRPAATIDHVAIGPTGVYVFASKNWSGPITTANGVLLRKGRGQQRATGSAREAAEAVGALLTSTRPEHVVPVICFTDGDVPDLTLDGVCVCSIVTVAYLLSFRPAALTLTEVEAVADELRRRVSPDHGKAR